MGDRTSAGTLSLHKRSATSCRALPRGRSVGIRHAQPLRAPACRTRPVDATTEVLAVPAPAPVSAIVSRSRMPEPNNPEVTLLLADLHNGVPGAADRLASAVMAELRVIAERAMRNERDGHTLQPTELVDEALIRLLGRQQSAWVNRAQFFAVAAKTIRLLLVDHARKRGRIKRDHGVRVTLDDAIGNAAADSPTNSVDLIALDHALEKLEAVAPRQAQVVELRYFGGLEIEETATALGISAATVKRDWTFARAFLLRTLEADAG